MLREEGHRLEPPDPSGASFRKTSELLGQGLKYVGGGRVRHVPFFVTGMSCVPTAERVWGTEGGEPLVWSPGQDLEDLRGIGISVRREPRV